MTATLCQSCGLCCNGVLFNRVSLYPDEVERITKRKLPMFDETRMKQPRGALEANGDCGIYSERPRRCSNYRCATLNALEDGAIDRIEAGVRVSRIRSRLGEIVAGEVDASVWERAGRRLARAQGEEETTEVIDALKRVVILLRRQFDDRFDPPPEIEGIY